MDNSLLAVRDINHKYIVVESKYDLPVRNIANGCYAIFEVEHTEESVSDFWKNIQTLTADLSIDVSKPIIERYAFSKISSHLCEFCIPLK